MGAIQSLKSWWQGIVAKDDLEVWNGQPSPEEAKEEARSLKKMRADLETLIVTTFSFLGDDVVGKISRRVHKSARDENGEIQEISSALRDGLLGDFFSFKRVPYVFLFDARYTEDAEKILCRVCTSYGIDDRFQYNEVIQGAEPSKVLNEFKEWLVNRSFDLIIFDTGGDEFCGFIVPLTAGADVLSRLRAIEVRATNVPSEA